MVQVIVAMPVRMVVTMVTGGVHIGDQLLMVNLQSIVKPVSSEAVHNLLIETAAREQVKFMLLVLYT